MLRHPRGSVYGTVGPRGKRPSTASERRQAHGSLCSGLVPSFRGLRKCMIRGATTTPVASQRTSFTCAVLAESHAMQISTVALMCACRIHPSLSVVGLTRGRWVPKAKPTARSTRDVALPTPRSSCLLLQRIYRCFLQALGSPVLALHDWLVHPCSRPARSDLKHRLSTAQAAAVTFLLLEAYAGVPLAGARWTLTGHGPWMAAARATRARARPSPDTCCKCRRLHTPQTCSSMNSFKPQRDPQCLRCSCCHLAVSSWGGGRTPGLPRPVAYQSHYKWAQVVRSP